MATKIAQSISVGLVTCATIVITILIIRIAVATIKRIAPENRRNQDTSTGILEEVCAIRRA